MAKLKYDYYDVTVPGDANGEETTLEWLADLAIHQAREQAKLYCMPCDWLATHVSGSPGDFEVKFRVRRRRNR